MHLVHMLKLFAIHIVLSWNYEYWAETSGVMKLNIMDFTVFFKLFIIILFNSLPRVVQYMYIDLSMKIDI